MILAMKRMVIHIMILIWGGENALQAKKRYGIRIPIWSMNYVGRVVGEHFNGDFLKEVLCHVPEQQPFRGPEIYRKD